MFTAALFAISRTWKQCRCPLTDEWIKKPWYIYMTEYYSTTERNASVGSNEVDEPRACYTVWSQSKRERQTSHINTCIWTLERWYLWSCLQGSNGDANREDRLVDTEGRSGWDELREQHWNTYITMCKSRQPVTTCCMMWGAQIQHSVTT